jgi:hypothetical protein
VTLVSTTKAARRYGLETWRVTDLCRRGQLTKTRQAIPDGQKRARWYCDLEELEEYLVRRGRPGRKFHQAEPWEPRLVHPPEPGQLSEIQLAAIAGEYWHELEDLQPVSGSPGAVRATWSDGEAFTIYQNGETDAYTYRDDGDDE